MSKAAPDGYTVLLLGAVHTVVPVMQNLPSIHRRLPISQQHRRLQCRPAGAKNFAEPAGALKAKGAIATYGSPSLGLPARKLPAR